jgi:hypothetical protein
MKCIKQNEFMNGIANNHWDRWIILRIEEIESIELNTTQFKLL